MAAKFEVFSLIGTNRVDYTMIVGKLLDNNVSSLIPLGVRANGQKPNLKIEIDDFEGVFPGGYQVESDVSLWGSVSSDGSSRQNFCLYPGTVLNLIPSENVLIRFSSTDQKNINIKELVRLRQILKK